ncbi:MAG TPA: putative toxin-antitoxin system toxin component, PIN family [Chitinophagaceae bacterium]|nr:putative toxin-antitoxin system toxin component, PIN family [Chitinophagaceae bacterium]
MKVVIDSNIFVMCMNPISDYHTVFKKLLAGNYTLYITTEILFEYTEVFQRKFSSIKAELLNQFLYESPYVKDVEVYFKWNLVTTDADDNKYIDCYIASNADYLVTNDRHFDALEQVAFPKVNCIKIDEFIKIIGD